MRSDDGYTCYSGDGEWDFASTSLGQFTAKEVNALFDLVGLTPDPVEPLGACQDCAHAEVGADGKYRERGWAAPCVRCKRPKHDLFELRIMSKAARHG